MVIANESVYNFSEFDYYDPFEYPIDRKGGYYAVGVLFFLIIFFGILLNVFGLTFLIRCRMWLQHEGYVYLTAIFATNIGILFFDTTSFWLSCLHSKYYPPNASEFTCKVWHFFTTVYFASGWLSVALLFDVYLREHLVHRRRCGCPLFAAKYCTLFASKVIVGVIFGLVIVLGLPCLGFYTLETYESPYTSRITTHCVPRPLMAMPILTLVQFGLMWAIPLLFFLPVILILVLCISREGGGGGFGFSQIEDRSVVDEQFRVMAVTLSSMALFGQFVIDGTRVLFRGVRGFSYITVCMHMAHAVCFSLQPILCLIILKKFRENLKPEVKRISNCCRRVIPNRLWLGANESIHMGDVEGPAATL